MIMEMKILKLIDMEGAGPGPLELDETKGEDTSGSFNSSAFKVPG